MGYGTNSGYGGGYNTNPSMGNTSLQNTFPTQQYQGGGGTTTNYMTMPYQYGQNSPMGSTPPPGYTPQPQMPYGPLSMMGGMPPSMPFNPPPGGFGPVPAPTGSQRTNPVAAPAGEGAGSFRGGVSGLVAGEPGTGQFGGFGSGSLPPLNPNVGQQRPPGAPTTPGNTGFPGPFNDSPIPIPGASGFPTMPNGQIPFVSATQNAMNTRGLTPMQIGMGTYITPDGRLSF